MKIVIAIVATLVVVSGLAGAGWKWLGGKKDAETVTVRVEPVSKGDLIEIVSAPGQLQPRTKVSISAKTTARIDALPFEEGATVKRGEVIVQLDAKDLAAQLTAAKAHYAAQTAQVQVAEAHVKSQEATIAATRAQLTNAEADLRRQKALPASDVSQSVVDLAESKAAELKAQVAACEATMAAELANVIVLKHELEAAAADIARAEENLSYATIRSPIDGVVTRVNAKIGEVVVMGTMNNMGTVILEVADLAEMQVDAQIDESNVASVRAGEKAKVRISAYADELFDGVVKLVALDVIDPRMGGGGGGGGGMGGGSAQGRWYRAKVVVDTKGRRIPAGLSADVDVETNSHKDVIKVPTQAVMGRPVDDLPAAVKNRPEVDKNKTLATVVFRFEGDKAVITPVTIGASDMTHTEITSGLSVGQQLIVGPYKVLPTLNDGMKLKKDASAGTTTTKPATTKAS